MDKKKMKLLWFRNNPIKQDIKNGQLREYKWGTWCLIMDFSLTWENPHIFDKFIKKRRWWSFRWYWNRIKQLKCGEIVGVKVITLALIDEDETDWKVIVINNKDLLAEKINGLKSLKKYLPEFKKRLKSGLWIIK